MLSTYTDVTKAQARAMGAHAIKHGYQIGRTDGRINCRSVLTRCPDCGDKLEGWLGASDIRPLSVRNALIGAMVDHLTSGDCSAHPDRLAVQ